MTIAIFRPLQSVEPSIRPITPSMFLVEYCRYAYLCYLPMNLVLNVYTFHFWGSFSLYVFVLWLLQTLCSVYGYMIASLDKKNELLGTLLKQRQSFLLLYGFIVMLSIPLVFLGFCGYRMADDVGIF